MNSLAPMVAQLFRCLSPPFQRDFYRDRSSHVFCMASVVPVVESGEPTQKAEITHTCWLFAAAIISA